MTAHFLKRHNSQKKSEWMAKQKQRVIVYDQNLLRVIKGQDVMESHSQPDAEGTGYIKEVNG